MSEEIFSRNGETCEILFMKSICQIDLVQQRDLVNSEI